MPTLAHPDGTPDSDRRPLILAINNDQGVLALYRDLLESNGQGPYRVTTSVYVDKDLAAIESLGPDLIVLDYMWAAEDSGWALLQMLRMNPATAAIPIVLCTGAAREVEGLRGHLDNMGVRVVLKPFNIDALEGTIATAMADRRGSARGQPAGDG